MALAAMVLVFESAQTAPAQPQSADTDVLSKDAVLRDPEIPALGNPNGDITIVEYFDYQCPYCKKISPVLDQVISEDKKVRLVLKDWPILGDPSGYAARLVLRDADKAPRPWLTDALPPGHITVIHLAIPGRGRTGEHCRDAGKPE